MSTPESQYLKTSLPTDELARIALFIPTLNGGGAERVMLNLGKEIASRGYPVDLVVGRASGPLLDEVPAAVRLIDLKCSRILATLPHLVQYLRTTRPVGLLSTIGHANVIALWARILSRVPVRIIVRETSTPSEAGAHARLLRSRFMPFLAKVFYPGADGIVAASQGMAEDIAHVFQIPRERIEVIYNPAISAELFRQSTEPITHPWFQPGAPPVVLGIGRLHRAKDFPLLIKAFSLLKDRCQARLVILGEGEERLELGAKARALGVEAEVDLPGFVSNPFPYMRQAGVFVLSSAWEGLPNALIQALALGTPVVSTDCRSGPREILKEGTLGELIPVGNPEVMSKTIEAVLGGKRFPVQESDLDRFRSDAVTQKYLDLILGGQMGVNSPLKE